jgi:hypothetical protein
MSNRQLGGPPQRRDDDIIDAEFVDVEDWKGPGALPPAAPPPRRRRGCWTYGMTGLGLVLLLLIGMCVAFPPPADTTAATTATDVTANDSAEDTPSSDAAPSSDASSLADLVQNGDARACDHPDTVETIRSRILPTSGKEDAATLHLLELARVDLTEASASSIRPEVHEITCDANLRYGDRARDVEPITFRIRAAADSASPPIVYFDLTEAQVFWLPQRILARPREIVEAERAREAPPPQQAEALSPVGPTEDNVTAPAATADDQFAPH